MPAAVDTLKLLHYLLVYFNYFEVGKFQILNVWVSISNYVFLAMGVKDIHAKVSVEFEDFTPTPETYCHKLTVLKPREFRWYSITSYDL